MRKFIGKVKIKDSCPENSLVDDEVDISIISPQMYEELIFPYEDELSGFFGGINWSHSCGNKTAIVSTIKKISRPIGFMDFRLAVDDLQIAVRNLNGKIPLHVRASAEDILTRSEKRIINQLEGIVCMCSKEN